MKYIYCVDLTIGFKGKNLANIKKLNLEKGMVLPLIGANGCGKSTLLKTLAKLIAPTQGQVHYTQSISDVAYLPEKPPLFDNLTVEEHLIYTAHLHHNPHQRQQVLKSFELSGLKNMMASHLSAGQRKTLSLASLALFRPKVLLLDEPTADLDTHHREMFHRFVYDASQKGAAIIFSTHHEADLIPYAHGLKIDHGELLNISLKQTQAKEVALEV